MKLFGLDIRRQQKDALNGGQDIDVIMRKLHAFYDTVSGIHVTPENCMQSPTVHALVTGVSRRLSTMPIQVIKKTRRKNRETRERMPEHSVAKLLKAPNPWQTTMNYWLDATSVLMRHGNYVAFKGQGKTGPIRRLVPFDPTCIGVVQEQPSLDHYYRYNGQRYESWEVTHARGAARNFLWGDSPVNSVRETIALEIAAEKFGASFFGNGALPFIVFKFNEAIKKGFKDEADQDEFLSQFQAAYTQGRQFRAFALPAGMDMSSPVDVSNDKAQFIETRKFQRTVIAGAWGVPPHIAGDLERATFNNVEQQGIDMQIAVILPHAMMFEAAMERDLLTDADRNSGICIRFNMDAVLRGDFKSRQDGAKIQRDGGMLTTNEWREREGMNPIEEDWADKCVMPAQAVFASDDAGKPVDPNAPKPVDPNAPKPGAAKFAQDDLLEELVDEPKGIDYWEAVRDDLAKAREINYRTITGK